jgi:hypothetical protein
MQVLIPTLEATVSFAVIKTVKMPLKQLNKFIKPKQSEKVQVILTSQ